MMSVKSYYGDQGHTKVFLSGIAKTEINSKWNNVFTSMQANLWAANRIASNSMEYLATSLSLD